MKLFFACASLCTLLTACNSSTPESDPSSADVKEVKKVISSFDNWMVDKDPKLLKDLFTEETESIVYTVSSEIWKGAASIRKKVQKNIDKYEDVSIDVRDQVVKVTGNTAWFSERSDSKFDYNGQRQTMEGVRSTGVLLKENGKWKIVQWHTSNPVRTAQEQQPQQQQ